MVSPPLTRRRRSRTAVTLVAAASLCAGFAVAAPASADPVYDDVVDGLVHRFELNEASGTVVANTGSAGAAANATLVHPEKAQRSADGGSDQQHDADRRDEARNADCP